MQETSVYHSDYVEPDHPNDVRGQAIYNSQPATSTVDRDTHFSHRQNLPMGQPSSKYGGGAPSYPTINSWNATQEVPSSHSRLVSYFKVPGFQPLSAIYQYVVQLHMTNRPCQWRLEVVHPQTLPTKKSPEQPTQRRYSDGDQNPPPKPVESSGRSSAPLIRSVRWTENLVCPSPVPTSQRRKGWFNRRG